MLISPQWDNKVEEGERDKKLEEGSSFGILFRNCLQKKVISENAVLSGFTF